MKLKIAAVLFSAFLMVHALYAQTLPGPVTVLPQPATVPAPAGPAVGIVAVVKGKVEIVPDGKVGRIVSSGETVYLGDAVTTGPDSTLQILLLDETVFTIGPDSSIVIDEFVYDPKTHDGKIDARILKGVFRLVTGNIAHKDPKRIGVKLPSGEVGIRGTMLYGNVQGLHSTLLLLGPGENNNTAHRKGEIAVRNEVNGQMKESIVNKSGFGSEIPGENQAPLPSYRFSDEQINQMTTSLNQPPPQQEEKDSQGSQSSSASSAAPETAQKGSATEQAGQDTFIAADQALDFDVISDTGEALSQESDKATQDAADDSLELLDGLTSIDDLSRIETGQFKYGFTGDLFSGTTDDGDFTFAMNIDFGARTIGGGGSKITGHAGTINSNTNFQFNIPTTPFDQGLAGYGIFDFSGLLDSTTPTPCTGCSADVTIVLANASGNVAQAAIADVTVTKSVSTVEGSGVGDRVPGQS